MVSTVGVLGADFEAVDGRWRITRILKGENWNPQLVSPLTQPGAERGGGARISSAGQR